MAQRLRKDGDVPAIAFRIRLADGYSPDNPLALAERSMIIEPVPHPDFEMVMNASGATRLGTYTWTFGTDEFPSLNPLVKALRTLRPGHILPAHKLLTAGGNPTNLREGYRTWIGQHDWMVGGITPEVRQVLASMCSSMGSEMLPYLSTTFENAHGFIGVSTNGRSFYLTASTMMADQPVDDAIEYGQYDERLKVRVNLRQPGKSAIEPKPAYPAAVFQTATFLTKQKAAIVIDEDVAALKAQFDSSIIAYPAPGRPAEVAISIGPAALRPELYSKLSDSLDDQIAGADGQSGRYGVRTISRVEEVFEVLKAQDPNLAINMHPKTEDLYRLVRAEPVEDERLRAYQRKAVGMHLATKYGYTNALEPGMGKTICALDAMRRRSTEIESYRGLIVVEANVRAQWSSEASVWFPEARLITVYGNENLEELTEALAGSDPVVAVVSYAMAGRVSKLIDADEVVDTTTDEGKDQAGENLFVVSDPKAESEDDEAAVTMEPIDPERGEQVTMFTWDGNVNPELTVDAAAVEEPVVVGTASIEKLLDDTHWHDLVADEAAVLRNPGTSQAKALWKLRANADIAVALTGTPINRNGIDDLGRLIAWTRNDAQMFVGARLSNAFDVAIDEDLVAFNEAVGPLVFRRNKSDISEELPGLKTEVVLLQPTGDELELARAARDELKRVYVELVALMELVEGENPNDPRIDEAKEALKAARGAWLGGTQLARMAASDPAALIGSASAGVELLDGAGLIEAATKTRGTKRSWAVEACKTRVADGKQVIVFTEFATVARGLIYDLEQAGIAVGGILGGGGKQRDRNIEAFRDGEISVLVATSAGKRGLNLQTATTVIHYDLPWTPDDVAQRTARVERIGATADEVEVLFPIAKGTIEERIVALLATRAATAVRALDVSRGADGSTTDMGRILAGLLPAVDGSQLDAGQMTMLDITRALVAA